MKDSPLTCTATSVCAILEGRKTHTRRVIKAAWWRCLDPEDSEDRVEALAQCPYGGPGDRLWVREAWRTAQKLDDKTPREIGQDCLEAGYPTAWCPVLYLANDERQNWDSAIASSFGTETGRYRNPRFMPRWLSRIDLEMLQVRIERVQDITEADAIAEGCASRQEFSELWDRLHASTDLVWDRNPWNWVLVFRRVA